MENHRFVIAGQECNKNSPKILVCFDTFHECIEYLNKNGERLERISFRETSFDIHKYKTDEEFISINEAEAIFEHVALFKYLFVDGILIQNRCLHKGQICIFKIEYGENFNWVNEQLQEMYC